MHKLRRWRWVLFLVGFHLHLFNSYRGRSRNCVSYSRTVWVKHLWYIDGVLSIHKKELENNRIQIYPVDLEIKDRTENIAYASYLDFTPVDREGQSTSHFLLKQAWPYHFLLSQTFRSNITYSPAYGVFVLTHSFYNTPGLATRMDDFFFWDQRDFPISFLNKDKP